jgi:hypothetical protein
LESSNQSAYKEAFVGKMEGVVSHWSSLVLAVAAVALAGAANAREYKIGCANGDCAIVDDTGMIAFYTVGNKTVAEGADQLKAPEIGRIRPPLNVACSAASGGETCVITDADGYIWVGPARPGTAFGAPITRIPVPGAH